jgi:DNA-binding NarL/FixJ family response regulator
LKILLVDDHTLFRDGFVLILKQLAPDYETVCAGSCDEALAQLARNPDTDLVLLDFILPDVQGTQAIESIRRKHPELPVVVLSGDRDVDVAEVLASVRAGAMGFIPKSHSATLLIGALTFMLVHKGIYLPPELFLGSTSFMQADRAGAAPAENPRVCKPSDLGLTPRQADVLYYVLQGKSNKGIARELGVEDNTVRSHVTVVLKALRVTTRTEAIVAANKMGLVFADTPKRSTRPASPVRS